MDRLRMSGWMRRAADAIADVAEAAVTTVSGDRPAAPAKTTADIIGEAQPAPQRNTAQAASPGAEGAARLERDWRHYLRQYNQPVMRHMVAETIPDIVGTMWRDEFLELPYMAGGDAAVSTESLVPPTDGSVQRGVAGLSLGSPAAKRPASNALDDQATTLTRRFVHEVIRRTHVSTAAMLLALYFVHRYRTLPRAEVGNAGSQFRMFLVAMLLAHKYSEDHPFTNKVWAQLSEVPVACVNDMERDFLARVDHRLCVRLGDFQRWVVGLDRRFGWTATSAVRGRDYRAMPLPPPPAVGRSVQTAKVLAPHIPDDGAPVPARRHSHAPSQP